MRSRTSESLIVLPLLPIFLVGLPPMLLLSFLGFAGLVILGMLLICVGLSDGFDANNAFNEEVIVHGYARRSERAVQASNLHSAIRFGTLMTATGRRVDRRRGGRRSSASADPGPLTNSSVALPAKFEHGNTACGTVAAYRFSRPTEKQGSFSECSNSTSTDRPTRPRSRSSSRKPASPIEPVPVDTRAGDQFKPEYLAVNPNAKVPAIDDDGVKVFDSNAILLYLAEKTGKFLPPTTRRPTAPSCCPG